MGAPYRQEVLHVLESIGQPWRTIYSSPSLASLCATVSVGLGVSPLLVSIVQAKHRVLGAVDGFLEIGELKLAPFAWSDLDSAGRALRDRLAEMYAVRAQAP